MATGSATRDTTVLVGTRKGLFILLGDASVEDVTPASRRTAQARLPPDFEGVSS